MNLAYIATIAVASASMLAAACGGAPHLQAKPAPAEAVERVDARLAQAAPVATFRGDGNTCRNTGACALGAGGVYVLTGSFHLGPGIAVIRAKDAGSGVFWVGLIKSKPGVDPLNSEGAASIQVIGPFDGAGWLAVDGGDYYMAITAYGGYQISVEQPDANTPVTTQRSFSGNGTQLTSLMALSAGKYTLTANSNHDLYVQLVDLYGDVVSADDGSAGPNYLQLATTGTSTKAFTVVLDGSYMLAIRTTSTETSPVSWTVAIN